MMPKMSTLTGVATRSSTGEVALKPLRRVRRVTSTIIIVEHHSHKEHLRLTSCPPTTTEAAASAPKACTLAEGSNATAAAAQHREGSKKTALAPTRITTCSMRCSTRKAPSNFSTSQQLMENGSQQHELLHTNGSQLLHAQQELNHALLRCRAGRQGLQGVQIHGAQDGSGRHHPRRCGQLLELPKSRAGAGCSSTERKEWPRRWRRCKRTGDNSTHDRQTAPYDLKLVCGPPNRPPSHGFTANATGFVILEPASTSHEQIRHTQQGG
jgi:hypothetical protein